MMRVLLLLTLSLISSLGLAQDLRKVTGDCGIMPSPPSGYVFSSVETTEERETVEGYNPSFGTPYNDCATLSGAGTDSQVLDGKCTRLVKSCEYSFKKSKDPQAVSNISIIERDCSEKLNLPPEYTIESRSERDHVVVADSSQYNPNYGFPYNDCRTVLGSTATVKDGKCTRTEKRCVYAIKGAGKYTPKFDSEPSTEKSDAAPAPKEGGVE